jgi:hypothetical protein
MEDYSMNLQTVNNTTQFITGGLILVESMLILGGTNIPRISPWANAKNLTLAISDITMGAILMYYALQPSQSNSAITFVMLSTLAATHIYRDMEYFGSSSAQPFLFNEPLMVLNNVRLGLTMASMGLGIWVRY